MKKVYCEECYYYLEKASKHHCYHPKWMGMMMQMAESAIKRPGAQVRWLYDHEHAETINRRNNCRLFKKYRWYHLRDWGLKG